MNIRHVLVLLKADGMNIRRDPMLAFCLIASLIFGLLLRFALPIISGLLVRYLSFNLDPWYPLIQTFFLFIGCMLCGFLSAFMILEEKDSHLFESLFVTPIGRRGYWAYRIAFPAFLSAIANFITFTCANLRFPGPTDWMMILILACEAVMFSTILSSFASNKIVALAMGKAGSIIMFATFLPWFVPAPWYWFAAVVPTFWPGIMAKDPQNILYGIGALAIHSIFLILVLKKNLR